jgi:hypothetical protein
MIEYTIEFYKTDKRTKKGVRFVEKRDFAPVTKDYINSVAKQWTEFGFIVKVFETYVTRKNLVTGREFQERYDTPYFCSPSSESYWSM